MKQLPHFRIFALIFGLLSLFEVVALSQLATTPLLHYISKPLITLSLLVYFSMISKGTGHPVRLPVILALDFSFMGDIMLLFPGDSFFVLGLSCFLFAHIAYLFAFAKGVAFSESFLRKKPWILLLLLPNVLFLLNRIEEGLGTLQLPVYSYTGVILLMVAAAINRRDFTAPESFRAVMIGALLFMVSDSILAIDRFSEPVNGAPYLVMITYMGAQFFITMGMLLHVFSVQVVEGPTSEESLIETAEEPE